MELTYLTAADVVEATADETAPRSPSASGYGDKVPTAYRVRLTDRRWRRVYAVTQGNGASLYVFRNGGHRFYLSTLVESALEDVRDDGATWADALANVVAAEGNAGLGDDRETVRAYGRVLALHGFEVAYHAYGRFGFLTYRDPETGYQGSFERSEFEGWDHHMPLVRSRKYGSSMWFLADDASRWTVEAARLTARETNTNRLVGTQRNAGDRERELRGGERL